MKKLPWFRLYRDIIHDDKIKLLAFEDRWHFVAILCMKCDGLLDEPESDVKDRRIAVNLGVQVRELGEIRRRLVEVGLVDETLNPLAWDELQFKSDSSAERVRAYRERVKQPCNVSVTPQDTDTDTDTDTDPDKEKPAEEEKPKQFTPPSLEEVQDYCLQRNNGIDPEAFIAFYTSKDWMIGKGKMKCWQSCVITWEKRDRLEAGKESLRKRPLIDDLKDTSWAN